MISNTMAILQAWAWMILLLFITSQPAKCEKFHIIPSNSQSPCPGRLTGEPCFTLQQFIRGEYKQYTSDPSEIVLEFQPGPHSLSSRYPNTLLVSQLVSFTMISINSTEIYCGYGFLFQTSHVQNVYISGISFIGCRYQIESVVNFTLKKSSFAYSQVRRLTALYIRSSSATIERCIFTNNNIIRTDNTSLIIDYSSFFDNNIESVASVSVENGHNKNVTISNSNFTRNTGNGNGALSVFTSYLEIYNTTFDGNRGRQGGGALAVLNVHSIVNISHCSFVNNRAL